jgi:hypothetical protein
MNAPIMLPLSQLQTDPALLMRVAIDEETCASYAEAMRDKKQLEKFPPLIVMKLPDAEGSDAGRYVVCDGHHRLRGARLAGLKSFLCDVREGNRDAAILLAAASNAAHGRPRSAEEKRLAVLAVYALDAFKAASARLIAEKCAVSVTFASGVLKTVHGGQLPATTGKDGKVRKAPKRPKVKAPNTERKLKTLARAIDLLAKKWPKDEPLTELIRLLFDRAADLERRNAPAPVAAE